MTLFFDPCGPKVTYRDGVLWVSDLNPHVETRWRMSRMEILRMGWRCIRAALKS